MSNEIRCFFLKPGAGSRRPHARTRGWAHTSKQGSGTESLNTKLTVKSVGDLRHEADLARKQAEELDAQFRQAATALETGGGDADSADELMRKDEDESGTPEPGRAVKRRAGLGGGMMNPAAKTQPQATKKLKKAAAGSAASAASAGPVEAAPAAEQEGVLVPRAAVPSPALLRLRGAEKPSSEQGRPSSKTGGKAATATAASAGAEAMDEEMQSVAEHCGPSSAWFARSSLSSKRSLGVECVSVCAMSMSVYVYVYVVLSLLPSVLLFY